MAKLSTPRTEFYVPTTWAPAMVHPAGEQLGFSLGPENAMIDATAADALERLVTGPVSSWQDLDAAEMGVRALVLHDRVDLLLPAIVGMVDQPTIAPELTINMPLNPPPAMPEAFWIVFNAARMHHRNVFSEVLRVSGSQLVDAPIFWRQRASVLLGNDDQAKRELFVEYLATSFRDKYVATPSAMDSGSYFGAEVDRVTENAKLRAVPIDAFVEPVSSSWKATLEELRIGGMDLRVGPCLSIALSRAKTRHELPLVILELRQEMEQPRRQLWHLVEEARYETDPRKTLKRLRKISAAAQAVVPAAFPKNLQPMRIAWDAVKRAGLVAGVAQAADVFVERALTRRSVSTVDAARLISDSLRTVDFGVLLEKHLSAVELSALRNPR